MNELLMSKSCVEFSEVLAARITMPGGGTASALVGALGAALCSMAANFTIGNKKYASFDDEAKTILEKSERLRTRLLELADEDAKAFPELAAAYKLPKDNPDRDKIYEQAALNACKAPIEMIKCCAEAIDLIEKIAEKGNKMLVTDAGGGALLCKAAMESAAMNVFINTSTLKNDNARKIEADVNDIINAYSDKATRIADKVKNSLTGKSHSANINENEIYKLLFKMFMIPGYRKAHNEYMNLSEREIIIAEGVYCPQWSYGASEYEENTSDLNPMAELNMLLEVTSDINKTREILGDSLQSEVILPGDNNRLVRNDGNYMIVAIKFSASERSSEIQVFNNNAPCDITINDATNDNSGFTGNIAFYGMPILNGIRVTNSGNSPVTVYYVKCKE